MSQTTCDNCNEAFTIKLKTNKRIDGIHETYFICPECHTRYTAFVTDSHVRKKQRQIRELQKEKKFLGNDEEVENELNDIQEPLAIYMSKLKDTLKKNKK